MLALLPEIYNAECRLDISLEILRRSPIPWTKDVDNLIQDCTAMDGARRMNEFKEQHCLMKLKKMLMQYGVKSFNVSDTALAKSNIMKSTTLIS